MNQIFFVWSNNFDVELIKPVHVTHCSLEIGDSDEHCPTLERNFLSFNHFNGETLQSKLWTIKRRLDIVVTFLEHNACLKDLTLNFKNEVIMWTTCWTFKYFTEKAFFKFRMTLEWRSNVFLLLALVLHKICLFR